LTLLCGAEATLWPTMVRCLKHNTAALAMQILDVEAPSLHNTIDVLSVEDAVKHKICTRS